MAIDGRPAFLLESSCCFLWVAVTIISLDEWIKKMHKDRYSESIVLVMVCSSAEQRQLDFLKFLQDVHQFRLTSVEYRLQLVW